ncbi:hypothetical protein D1872_280770 [compost metagenome]
MRINSVFFGSVINCSQYATDLSIFVPPPSWIPNSISTGSLAHCSVKSTTSVSKTTTRVSKAGILAKMDPTTDAQMTDSAIDPLWSISTMTVHSLLRFARSK